MAKFDFELSASLQFLFSRRIISNVQQTWKVDFLLSFFFGSIASPRSMRPMSSSVSALPFDSSSSKVRKFWLWINLKSMFLTVTLKIERILMEHIEMKNSSEYKLQLSIRVPLKFVVCKTEKVKRVSSRKYDQKSFCQKSFFSLFFRFFFWCGWKNAENSIRRADMTQDRVWQTHFNKLANNIKCLKRNDSLAYSITVGFMYFKLRYEMKINCNDFLWRCLNF